jgi:hypothetical protein
MYYLDGLQASKGQSQYFDIAVQELASSFVNVTGSSIEPETG